MIQSTDQDAYKRVRLCAFLYSIKSLKVFFTVIKSELKLKSLPKRKRLQERNEVSHNFLVGEIELVDDDGVDVIV